MTKHIKFLSGNVLLAIFLILWAFVLMCAGGANAAEKVEKGPVARYWLSVSTEKSGMPGMPGGFSGIGGLFGKGGDGGKKLLLQLNSTRSLPDRPAATHDIPPAQNMGETLPLMIPERERSERPVQGPGEPGRMEKPKMKMLIYWGCGETVRKGQPRVLDTERMSMAEFGRAMGGRVVSPQYPPAPGRGLAYADWPNREDSTSVPKDSSLAGAHNVHGNYIPDMKFSIDRAHDFMAPVEFTSIKGTPGGSITFKWNAIPTATGYFAMASGYDQKTGTMILWSSSEVPEPGYTLMNYLPDGDVRKLVREKVVMAPGVTQCTVPKGVFRDAGGAMLQFIGYGSEMNLAYPPERPKNPLWTVKVRRKTTGMAPLMSMDERTGREDRGRASRGEGDDGDGGGPSPGKSLKSLFGF